MHPAFGMTHNYVIVGIWLHQSKLAIVGLATSTIAASASSTVALLSL